MAIRVALLGIGNASSILLQGLEYYKGDNEEGLWHTKVGNYTISDISIVGAFDIDKRKVGLELTEAIFVNNITRYTKVPKSGIIVNSGILEDELPLHLREIINVNSNSYDNLISSLKEIKPDIVVNLISSGLDNTSKLYAKASLEVGADFINATPTDLKSFLPLFKEKGLMIVGDDLMSQFGGTAFHKSMIDFMVERGVKIEKSYQLDVGGSTETLNTINEKIKESKRRVKTTSIDIEAPYEFESIAGTTEYTQFLNDERVSYYWMKSKGFMNTPITIDIVLRTHDGSNAANVLLDVIRAVRYAKDNNRLELIDIIASYGFKNSQKIKKIREAYKEFVDIFVNV
ncbi:MAG: hypothetical protein QW416_06380 [Candidatus Nitrosocaldaceae archaeon]